MYGNSIWGATGNTIKGITSVLNNFPIVPALKFEGQSLFSTPGNILVNGSAFIKSGAVNGSVQFPAGANYTYVGPTPLGDTIRQTPIFPALPDLPGTSELSTGQTDITQSGTITSGSYNNVTLGGNQTLIFSGVGDYYFNSIELTDINNFTFDFKNASTGNIRLFIQGNATLANISVNIINGGNAGRIYTEVQGSGDIEGDNTALSMNINGTSAHWEGTVFVPYGSITIGQPNSGSANVINGALWSGSKHSPIGFNTTLTFIPLGSGNSIPTVCTAVLSTTGKRAKYLRLIGSELTQLYNNPSA